LGDGWELPVPVEAEHDATEVVFPWSQAGVAVDKLFDLWERLGSFEMSDRSGIDDLISDWEGPFRDEFDDVQGDYMADVVALRQVVLDLAGNIIDHAHAVNGEQEDRNGEAYEEWLENQSDDEEGD
jgi:uncharacterized protein YukE